MKGCVVPSPSRTARLRMRAQQGISGRGFAKHVSGIQQPSRKKTLVSTVDSIMRETTEIERRAEENIRREKKKNNNNATNKKKKKMIQRGHEGDTGIGDMLPEEIHNEHAARGRVDFVTVCLRQRERERLVVILSRQLEKIFFDDDA